MNVRHYLDHAASSPMLPAVAEAMAQWHGVAGNPSSLHASGRAARRAVEEARESLAADLGCDAAEVVFTSGGTEADNLALQGSWEARRTERNGVVTTTVEHPAIIEVAGALAGRGADVQFIAVDGDGLVDHDQLAAAVSETAAVVSVQWVNNETGVVQDVAAATALARAAGVWSHSDAVQALGHLPVDFRAAGLDLMSVSAHKVGGPVGIGALVLRREIEPAASSHGGGQERRLRSGTVPVALAVGFAAAVRIATEQLAGEAVRLRGLADRLEAAARALDPAIVVNGAAVSRSPAIVNLTFPGVRADDLLMLLDAAGIDSSTGSACTAGVSRPSEVLLAMGRTEAEAGASLRFSLGHTTTEADLAALLAVLPAAVSRARDAGRLGR